MNNNEKNINETIEIFTDYIDSEGYVLRYNYEKGYYYNTGICLKGSLGNPGRPGRPGKDGDSWDLRQVDGIYYWFKNGINQHIPAQISGEGGGVPTGLAPVATTGDYNDLINKPTITNGKSAYLSYVDTTSDNPVLTEELWIASLKGTDGLNGTNGLDGQNGVTPHIDSETKHWIIGSTDTGIVAEGQDGSNGADGSDGSDGLDGITPTITITPITGGNTVEFNYGNDDPRNISFDVMNGTSSSLNLVQSNWNESDNNSPAYIQNKPTIPQIWTGTQLEYDALVTKDASTIYIIK